MRPDGHESCGHQGPSLGFRDRRKDDRRASARHQEHAGSRQKQRHVHTTSGELLPVRQHKRDRSAALKKELQSQRSARARGQSEPGAALEQDGKGGCANWANALVSSANEQRGVGEGQGLGRDSNRIEDDFVTANPLTAGGEIFQLADGD